MTLLRDLISIPTQVHASDFVISLKDGWADPRRVVDDYVVTDDLAAQFDKALDLVDKAVGNSRSMGAYLHGSFGSGKSHFMAVLHQLLTDGSPARASAQFGNVVAKHVDALAGKRFLLVPVHFIGGDSMAQQILGGYVDYVRRLHPDAQTPAVYIDDDLIANARSLRAAFGDQAFFEQLAGAGGDDGWGGYSNWSPDRFDAAANAAQGSEERRELVSALLDTVLSSYTSAVESSGKGFVPLEAGLAIVSQHASSLGYDAVVLFLDEMILWFASRMADQVFVNREGSLVAKLVECEHAERPAPIVSFIARQRDLRELVGDLPGAEKANFSDILKWWEGRFSTITLEDRNLVAITERRVLRPISDDARIALAESFQQVQQQVELQQHLDVLLGGSSTVDSFRRVYPFNPALIDALVALSSALQRDRTALKVMLQLLSDHRDDLELGELVPFGDLYDVIGREADPFTDAMKAQFVNARKLWDQRIAPMLAMDHGLPADDPTAGLPSRHAYWAEARVLKTVLLAALVPETPSLRAMTVSRIVALNHGTIRVPFAGTEQAQVLTKLRGWASQIGELRLGDDPVDPTVSIHLTGVDLEPLLEAVQAHDNTGQRMRLVREMVEQRLAIPTGQLQPTIEMVWRGTKRSVDVVIGNVRSEDQMPSSMFRAEANVRLIVDLPLDPERERSATDDFDRVSEHASTLGDRDTIVWLPNFLSAVALGKVGRLVRVKYLLNGDNLATNSSQLMSPEDRGIARDQLRGLLGSLTQGLETALDVAYGLTAGTSTDVTSEITLAQQFFRLGDGSSTAEAPVGRTLRHAAEHLGGQMLAGRYPAHPEFGDRAVTEAELRTALEWMQKLAGSDHGRLDAVPSADRPALRKVLNALRLAQMHENHIVTDKTWTDHFQRLVADHQPSPLTVGHLRRWIDEPQPMGLTRSAADLVVASFCALTNRVLRSFGEPVVETLGKLEDGWHIETSKLPSDEVWQRAVERAAHLGIIPMTQRLSVPTAEKLVRDLIGAYSPLAQAAASMAASLTSRMIKLGIDPVAADRARTATFTAQLLGRLGPDTLATLNLLGDADAPTSWGGVGQSAKTSASIDAELNGTNWELISGAIALESPGAAAIGSRLRAALTSEELAVPLARTLGEIERDATALFVPAATPSTKSGLPPTPPLPGRITRQEAEVELARIRKRLRAEAQTELSWEFSDLDADTSTETRSWPS